MRRHVICRLRPICPSTFTSLPGASYHSLRTHAQGHAVPITQLNRKPAVQQRRRWYHSERQSVKNKPPVDHYHLRGDEQGGLITYEMAALLQEKYRGRILAWKGLSEEERKREPVPRAMVLTFEAKPTFTLGRRQADLSLEQAAILTERLEVSIPDRHEPIDASFAPKVVKTSRGGLTTYHGPGQLVIWPILDMHSPLWANYSVSSYASHLEQTTQKLLSDYFSIKTHTTHDEPGVWVDDDSYGPARKIAALGVHHRRYVTALGTAINLDVPVKGDRSVNPWQRFVPCGLEGKMVTSAREEIGGSGGADWNPAMLAEAWVRLFKSGVMDATKRGGDSREEEHRL